MASTLQRLAEIATREQAATPPPWHQIGAPWGDGSFVKTGNGDPHTGRLVCATEEWLEEQENETHGAQRDWHADFAFIAHAREDVRFLLDLLGEIRQAGAPVVRFLAAWLELDPDLPDRAILYRFNDIPLTAGHARALIAALRNNDEGA